MVPIPHPNNTLNNLPGGQFMYNTRSVLQTAYPHGYRHDLRRVHGANKPPLLMAHLIETFTKPGMHVLDPMAGVGGSLIGAVICPSGPRHCDGIEISEKWTSVYQRIATEPCADLTLGVLPEYCSMYTGDALTLLKDWGLMYDFIVFDPPYNIHLKQTMSGKAGSKYANDHVNRRTDYDMHSTEQADVANAASYAQYLDAMRVFFARCYRVLREGRYLAFICQNTYQEGVYNFTHVDLARQAQDAGFVPKGEIVWIPAGKRLRPYGYPYQWVPNPIHATVVVLYKPKVAQRKRSTGE